MEQKNNENGEISKEKLIEEIEVLKTRIKNTEYDLTHMFKNNSFLEQKLSISKQTLEEKMKILSDIKPEKSKDKELKKIEEEIIEKDKNQISSDQEEIIEEEINEEIEK
jgi:hypothetical protein